MEVNGVLLVIFLATVVVLNTVAFLAWRRDLLPAWYSVAVAVAALALLVGSDFSRALALLGGAALAALSAFGAAAWWRGRTAYGGGEQQR